MTKKTRRKIDTAPKAKIALEAVREQADGGRVGSMLRGPPKPDRRVEEATGGTGCPRLRPQRRGDAEKMAQRQVDDLYAKIGQLTVEWDFLARRSGR